MCQLNLTVSILKNITSWPQGCRSALCWFTKKHLHINTGPGQETISFVEPCQFTVFVRGLSRMRSFFHVYVCALACCLLHPVSYFSLWHLDWWTQPPQHIITMWGICLSPRTLSLALSLAPLSLLSPNFD